MGMFCRSLMANNVNHHNRSIGKTMNSTTNNAKASNIEASDEGVYSDFVTEAKTPSVNRRGGGGGRRSMPIELKVTRSMSRSMAPLTRSKVTGESKKTTNSRPKLRQRSHYSIESKSKTTSETKNNNNSSSSRKRKLSLAATSNIDQPIQSPRSSFQFKRIMLTTSDSSDTEELLSSKLSSKSTSAIIPLKNNSNSRRKQTPRPSWQNQHSTPIRPRDSKVATIDVTASSSGDSSNETNDHKSRLSKTTPNKNERLTTMIQKVSEKLNEDSRVLPNCSVEQNEDADDEGSVDRRTTNMVQFIQPKPSTSSDINPVVIKQLSSNQNKVSSIITTKLPQPSLHQQPQQIDQQREMISRITEHPELMVMQHYNREYRDRLHYFDMEYQKKLLRPLLQKLIQDSSCLMAKWILKEVMDQYGFAPNPDLAQPLIRINSAQQPSIEFFFKGSRKCSSIVKILKSVDEEFLLLSNAIYSFAYAMYDMMSSKH